MTQEFNPERPHDHTYGEIGKYIENLLAERDAWREISYLLLHRQNLPLEMATMLFRLAAEKGDVKNGEIQ